MAESRGLQTALSGFGTVAAQTARLLARHWPAVLALTLAGNAARQLLLVAATKTTAFNLPLGSLVFSLVPIALLTAYVLAFRSVRRSIPLLTAQRPGTRTQMITDIGAALIPFFVIYSSYGQLRADFLAWTNAIQFDTYMGGEVLGREPTQFSHTMIAFACVAIVARLLFDRWKRAQDWLAVGIVTTYLDVISVTVVFMHVLFPIVNQFDRSRGVDGVKNLFRDTDLRFGSVSLNDLWHGLFSGLEPVIILPIAWLSVAAIIYGDRLREVPSRVELRTYRKLTIMPVRVRKALLGVSAPTRDRFAALVMAVRVLRWTNLGLILLFCLGFVVIMSLPYGLWELERWLIGPRDHFTWQELYDPLMIVNDAVMTMVLICYVAAGVARVLQLQNASADRRDEVRVPGQQERVIEPQTGGDGIRRSDEIHGPLVAG